MKRLIELEPDHLRTVRRVETPYKQLEALTCPRLWDPSSSCANWAGGELFGVFTLHVYGRSSSWKLHAVVLEEALANEIADGMAYPQAVWIGVNRSNEMGGQVCEAVREGTHVIDEGE